MPRRQFTSDARIPHGHHQNWKLVERVIGEMERVTSQWPDAETRIGVRGVKELHGSYDTLIDAEIDLGEDRRDVTEVDITRSTYDDDDDDWYLSVTLAKSRNAGVYATGPVKKTCEDLVRNLQSFILQAINYPVSVASHSAQQELSLRLQHLHPALREGSFVRLSNGHGDEAVEEACKSVGARLRALTGLDEDGVALVGKALGKNGRIAINNGVTKSEESEQEGIMHLGMALYRAARNPRAHRPADPDYSIDEVIEWLSVASALHRALDRGN
jgi:uncharacterized protein (TIGR02391 family)